MKDAEMPVLIYKRFLSARLDHDSYRLQNVSGIVIWAMIFQQTYNLNLQNSSFLVEFI